MTTCRADWNGGEADRTSYVQARNISKSLALVVG
jgi:hypothetical protein